jgi:hypothetical protein
MTNHVPTLTPINIVSQGNGRTMWLCMCYCGKQTTVRQDKLKRTKSCGCLRLEKFMILAHRKTHGMTKTSEFNAWHSMKERCLLPSNRGYKNYGGRGIKVCDRWLNSFENFIADMGVKPSTELTLERIDVNGDYEPSNCRWDTWHEQRINQRRMKNV